jgi:hypothetical protein
MMVEAEHLERVELLERLAHDMPVEERTLLVSSSGEVLRHLQLLVASMAERTL